MRINVHEIHPHIFTAFLLLFLLSYSVQGIAIECNEQSRNFLAQGDSYYELHEVKPLTKPQKAHIKRIFSRVKKNLKGEGTAVFCEGPEDDIEVEIDQETVKGTFNLTKDGRIIIELEIYNVDNKSTHIEKFKYLGKNDNYTLQETNKNSVYLVSKWRGQRRSRITPLNERVVILGVENDTLIFDIQHYFNGHFAYSYYRTLK